MRRNTRIITLCLALVILLVGQVAGLTFSAMVSEDGKQYHGIAQINNTDRYDLVQPGMVGERIPLDVSNLSVRNETVPLTKSPDRGVLTFPKGNYTIEYDVPVTAHTLQFLFTEAANVTVFLPHPFLVENPLLTSLQPSGSKAISTNNSTLISWDLVRSAEVRFYDENQEHLLYLFAQFWLIIAVVLLIPFFLSRNQ